MLSDKEKTFLLKRIQKIMKKDKLSLREVIDITREGADYLESLMVDNEKAGF